MKRILPICLTLLLLTSCTVPPEELGLPAEATAVPAPSLTTAATIAPAPKPTPSATSTMAPTPTATPAPTLAPTAAPDAVSVLVYDTLRLDVGGDGVEDAVELHSAYPMGEGEEGTYAPTLTWRAGERVRASMPIFTSYPWASAPTILQRLTDGETTYLLLGQYEGELFEDHVAYELYAASSAGLERIPLPHPEEPLYGSEAGVAFLREAAEILCPADGEALVRISWRGPYSIAQTEAGLACRVTIHLLHMEPGGSSKDYADYAEYDATLLYAEGGWSLLEAERVRHSTGIGKDFCESHLLNDAGQRESYASTDWRQYPSRNPYEGQSTRSFSVHWPAFHSEGLTRWGEMESVQEDSWAVSRTAATLKEYPGTPLFEGDRFRLYPVMDYSSVERVSMMGYGLYLLDEEGKAVWHAQFIAEEYGITFSNFPGTAAYCVTVTGKPIATCWQDSEAQVRLDDPRGEDGYYNFPLGRSAFLSPRDEMILLGELGDMAAAYALYARDIEGDGRREYVFVGVGDLPTLSAMDPVGSGYVHAESDRTRGPATVEGAISRLYDEEEHAINVARIPVWDEYPFG